MTMEGVDTGLRKTSSRQLILAFAFFSGFFGLLLVSWYGTRLLNQTSQNGSEKIAEAVVRHPQDHEVLGGTGGNQGKPSRVFCWIMTQPSNFEKALSVKYTWLERCDGYVFISSEDNSTLPSLDARLGEGRDILWGKTKFGFRYAYDFVDEYDWFLKADDDTYVVMENLRLLVSDHSSQQPLYFGHHFISLGVEGYMSGGAGYLLSQAALRKLIEDGLNKNICKVDNSGAEDAEMGICLHTLNVTFGDSRDNTGHNRFFPFVPQDHMKPNHMEGDWWYPKAVKFPEREEDATGENRTDCCSDSAITFHYVDNMYFMEYMLYHLRPHGLSRV